MTINYEASHGKGVKTFFRVDGLGVLTLIWKEYLVFTVLCTICEVVLSLLTFQVGHSILSYIILRTVLQSRTSGLKGELLKSLTNFSTEFANPYGSGKLDRAFTKPRIQIGLPCAALSIYRYFNNYLKFIISNSYKSISNLFSSQLIIPWTTFSISSKVVFL